MIHDTVVEDVHRARARLWDECGGDLERLLDRYKALEEQYRGRMVGPADVRFKCPNPREQAG